MRLFTMTMITGVLVAALSNAADEGTPLPAAADVPATSLDPGAFTATHKAADTGVVTELRPLVREIAPDDDLRAALHWSPANGPFPGAGEGEPHIDLAATLGRAKFLMILPDGTHHRLRAEFKDERHEQWHDRHAARFWTTVILTIDRDGVRADTPHGTLRGTWTTALPERFGQPGEYRLGVSGELVGQQSSYSVGAVLFRVAEGPLPVAEARKRARAAIAKHLPQATIPEQQGTESGLMPDVVYENAAGERLLHVRVLLSNQKWGYDLVQVRQSRTGDLLGLAHQEVGTCVATGTPIATPAGPRPVETLRAGDEVTSFDVDRSVAVRTRVVGLHAGLAPAVLRFGDLRVTGDHPIHTPQGWVAAADLGAESRVLGLDGRRVVIGQGERIDGATRVWCLSVEHPHTYFADGILVHNKSRDWSPNLDDPWHFYWAADGVIRKGEWKKIP